MAPKLYSPVSDLTLIGKGALWLDRFDATDTATGTLMALGNCDKFGIQVKDTVKKNYTAMDHTAGVYKTAISQREIMIKIEGFEFGPEVAAMNVLSDLPTAVTQTTASVVAEALAPVVVQKAGRAFQTVNREISAVIVIQSAVTLLLNVDYVIKDPHLGIIYFLETSPTVANAAAITCNYTAATIVAAGNMQQLLGGAVPKIRGKLIFSGDPMTGPNWDVIIPRVFLTPTAEMDFISNDFLKWKLDGTIEDNSAFNPALQYFKATRRA